MLLSTTRVYSPMASKFTFCLVKTFVNYVSYEGGSIHLILSLLPDILAVFSSLLHAFRAGWAPELCLRCRDRFVFSHSSIINRLIGSIVLGGTYCRADRSSAGVGVITLSLYTQTKLITGLYTGLINGIASCTTTISGLNGFVVLLDRNELYWVLEMEV